MHAAVALGDKQEYQRFVTAYVDTCAKIEDVDRIRDLFDFLLGPLVATPTWQSTIVGMQKRVILQSALQTLAKHPEVDLQRLTTEYRDHLQNVNKKP